MEVQVTDSETGFLSELQGMEPVFIRIADSEDELNLVEILLFMTYKIEEILVENHQQY